MRRELVFIRLWVHLPFLGVRNHPGMIVAVVAMSELAPATASELDSATTATSQLASWSASAVVTPRPGYCSSRGGCSPRTATPGHVYLVQHAEWRGRSSEAAG